MDGLSFSDQNIRDSQLQMIFAVCHPAIASEAQMALALRVLCGFGIEEIAEAFLTSKETINKRLFRAKERLREVNIPLEMPSEQELSRRLDNVLHILYLLFNAGYYSSLQNQLLRKDLCFEALHLGRLLTECSTTNTPETNALMALMCFHSSRFEARYNETVSYNLYEQQDESLWDQQLIEQGSYYLELAANGKEITSYHLEAGIAFWNTYKEDTEEKWENILQHYNLLMQINYSPVVALNRTYALYKARGKEAALQEAEKLQLTTSHFYYALLGELFSGVNDDLARQQYEKALSICKTESERQLILQKMKVL
jgi:RNA polymerase sigma-70 factor (ECF subfamily)